MFVLGGPSENQIRASNGYTSRGAEVMTVNSGKAAILAPPSSRAMTPPRYVRIVQRRISQGRAVPRPSNQFNPSGHLSSTLLLGLRPEDTWHASDCPIISSLYSGIPALAMRMACLSLCAEWKVE